MHVLCVLQLCPKLLHLQVDVGCFDWYVSMRQVTCRHYWKATSWLCGKVVSMNKIDVAESPVTLPSYSFVSILVAV